MKILLINPPNSGKSIPEERFGIDSIKQIFKGEPLALEVLAGNLTDHQVEIIDLKADPNALDTAMTRETPDIVGITGMTCEANAMKQIAGSIRKWGSAKVVVGGIHASSDPEFFNCSEIDYIVIGLGKRSFRTLVDAIEKKTDTNAIPGIAKINPGKTLFWKPRKYCTADLVDDKPPAYGLVAHYRKDHHYYLTNLKLDVGFVATAYGCPYRCSFCCIENLTSGRYLTHSIESVIRDIRMLGNTPVIRLLDANTFGSPTHARKLCDALIASGVNKRFLADVRSDTVVKYPELMADWKKAGLQAVVTGFEEVDDTNLKKMNKSNKVAVNTESIRILHDLGITIVGDFIISPDYTEKDFEKLGHYIAETKIDLPMITVMTPLPGTQQYAALKPQISIDNLDYYTLTNAVMPTHLPEAVFYQHYSNLIQTSHRGARL
jgi:radical SAM superfamily enzyme YgiQ (UPF0313 family)